MKAKPERKYKSLDPLKSKTRKHRIYSFDVETYGDDNTFLMGCVYGDHLMRFFWDREEMAEYLTTQSRFYKSSDGSPILFATNLGFDILAIFNKAEHFRNMRFTQRGSQIIRVEYIVSEDKSIIFLDTMNFSAISVEKMGEIVGFPKLTDHSFIIGDKDSMLEHREDLLRYNLRDCEITKAFAELLQTGFNTLGCDMRMTVASTSMNLFQRQHLKNKWYVAPPEIREFILKAYYGGRTEVFYRGIIDAEIDFGQDKLFYYDVNSLYPYCMKNFDYPNTNTYRTTSKGNINIIMEYEGVSHVKVRCPKMMYPFLPYRAENKLLFPYGTFQGYYTHVELRKALELGYEILAIYQSIYFKKTHSPFKDYVETLYNKRLEYKKENNPLELTTKLLMNSLYGKFAQKSEYEEMRHFESLTDKEYLEMTTKYEHKVVDQWIYFKVNDNIPNFSHPIYSAYITAYARITLYDWMMKAGTVFYVDTDSIMTPTKLPTSNKLGDLKLEHAEKRIIIVKPKMYLYNDKIIKLKGAKKIKTKELFEMIVEDGKKVEYMKFSKMKESIRRKMSFNKKMMVTKSIDLQDTKRQWKGRYDPNIMEKSEARKI